MKRTDFLKRLGLLFVAPAIIPAVFKEDKTIELFNKNREISDTNGNVWKDNVIIGASGYVWNPMDINYNE